MDPVITELQDMVQELYGRLVAQTGQVEDLRQQLIGLEVDLEKGLTTHKNVEAVRLARFSEIERRLDQLEKKMDSLV